MDNTNKKQIMMVAYLTLCITYGVLFYSKYKANKGKS
jgi:hypothetical protein